MCTRIAWLLLALAPALDLSFADESSEEARAIARIEELGGSIDRDDGQPDGPVTVIDLIGIGKLKDGDLPLLAPFSNLTRLYLGRTPITGASFKHGTQVTDDGVKQLQVALPKLRIGRQALGQRADPDFDVSIARPAYTSKHPSVLFDEAHDNFHTASGRYKAFADLITNDGYRVVPNKEAFTPERLAGHAVLIIANATARSGGGKSAFTQGECDSVQNWVKAGGSLLIITDHEPFGSASDDLGKRFDVEMSLRVAVDPENESSQGCYSAARRTRSEITRS
ncbi:MAG TPA: hypothetical protein VKU82_04370 [Planctomycetaceae bacterium]|nr:hypothetical protein [Planctomycetaceae bacterium]